MKHAFYNGAGQSDWHETRWSFIWYRNYMDDESDIYSFRCCV
jgi:hypothetical protein